ncbi:hypothetical protein [Ligilactobacillus acidipiscis]|uniref:hypothetical protein n=1 Tax=Ligilactobacillus acidipiscis TaxID=89059 RepID=UPI0023F68B10|nr:hypothetical protein [Ligilactobacillus acidipiscis]WEV57566.1 hypothetical protein OZX66_03170 [Ligilactobacillus acidipiscis]
MKRSRQRQRQKHKTRNILIIIIIIALAVLSGYLLASRQSVTTQGNKDESSDLTKNSIRHKNSSKQNNNTENETSSQQEETTSQESISPKRYSQSEITTLNKQFLNWAIDQAQKGNMAVTDNYFTHGASGSGDWYAETVDGKALVQAQALDNPGYGAYKIHVLGGVSFYTSKNGTIGYDDVPSKAVTADGLSQAADKNYQIHKYLLGDNGVVYEAIGSFEDLVAFSSPFGLYDDDGKTISIPAKLSFKVSQDRAAQSEWKTILSSI